ncbi:MAG: hypothetical protein AB8I08_21900 [Sandaracinaceae bacterium]
MLRVFAFAVFALGCSEPPPERDAGPPPDAALPDADVDAAIPFAPDLVCPGMEGCLDEGDDLLLAGAAAVAITPSLDDAEPLTVDVDGDGRYDPDDGDRYEDRNGNGLYDAIWIAGFGNGRAAQSVHDDQWARALVLRQNETTIAFVAVDAVGLFLDDGEPIREQAAAMGVDYVAVAATHGHEARDTIGIWGRTLDESGRDPAYMARIQEAAVQAIADSLAELRVAQPQYGSVRLDAQPGGILRYVSDTRDPQVIDPEVRILRVAEPDGTTIGTLVNFGAHPEYWGSSNTALSSDFPHWLRDGIENGVPRPDGTMRAGLGGTAVFINGAIGSQIGPGRVMQQTDDGQSVPRREMESPATLGRQVAALVLDALGPGGGSVSEESARLAVRRHRFFLPIENRRYHIAFLQGLFVRDVYNYDQDRAINRFNTPELLTEVAVIDVGRATMMTLPGELDPALFLGGYDGAYAPEGVPVVDPSLENPPDLAAAPEGPYLRDLAREDADQVWPLGLTGDFVGYLIPEFDFELDPGLPYIGEAPGDHYEETNAIGERGWPLVRGRLTQLLRYAP